MTRCNAKTHKYPRYTSSPVIDVNKPLISYIFPFKPLFVKNWLVKNNV